MGDKYEEIIKEKLGENFPYKVKYVKDNQCYNCKNKNHNSCRLEFKGNKCKNYIKAGERGGKVKMGRCKK